MRNRRTVLVVQFAILAIAGVFLFVAFRTGVLDGNSDATLFVIAASCLTVISGLIGIWVRRLDRTNHE